MNNKPLKRHEMLQPLSRDHHHGLLLCWKIRQGFKKNVEPERIKAYADWFWENHLKAHFEAEEKYCFTILPADHENVKRALADHKRIQRLFATHTGLIKNLNHIEEELEKHIRFEERVLFNQIQEIATNEQLQAIETAHAEKFEDNTADEFWR